MFAITWRAQDIQPLSSLRKAIVLCVDDLSHLSSGTFMDIQNTVQARGKEDFNTKGYCHDQEVFIKQVHNSLSMTSTPSLTS